MVRSNLAALLALCGLLLPALIAHSADAPRLSENGYGAVRIGMSVAQASKALGTRLAPLGDEQPNPDCYHVRPTSGHTELSFMVRKGRVVRASLYKGPSSIRTNRGIALGDPIDAVRKAYGKALEDKPHEYLGPVGRYLTWWDDKRQRGIRYETDTEGQVGKIHAGNDSITLIEGCS